MESSARTAIADFVSDGGTLIINADASSHYIYLLNSTFGYWLSSGSWGSPYNLNTTDAAGTVFAAGPASLPYNNGTYDLSTASLPAGALSIYEDASNTAVAQIAYGDGTIIILCWDWYDAAPTGSLDGGWLEVLYWAMATNYFHQTDATERGWWNETGFHESINNNTWTGFDSFSILIMFNSYFIFDLSGIAGDMRGRG